ncbi:MAG: DeoR/GlpR family DNA-binding transcription regulator [Propionibacteriaceae bacterium]|jgi:DeoR family fructose operon transcriptional repressor|nr:DeoR/GlpR family DNA-binding transcription regulator [Propionibacteriaceae bacterium]
MLAEQRFSAITAILAEQGSVTVKDLVDRLGTSEATIRRDLNALDSGGLLKKVFGGAVAAEPSVITRDELVADRFGVEVEAKQAIAGHAASLVEPGDLVYLDAGTSTEYLARAIGRSEATFVTNALALAKVLAAAGCRVYVVGGQFKASTEAQIGGWAAHEVARYNFTKGFFGTNGVSLSRGFTTPDNEEALVKGAALSRCRRAYVLADPSKFGAVSTVTFAAFDQATVLTTTAPDGFREAENVVEVAS